MGDLFPCSRYRLDKCSPALSYYCTAAHTVRSQTSSDELWLDEALVSHQHNNHPSRDFNTSAATTHHDQHSGGAMGGHEMHREHAHDKHEGHSVGMFRRKFWVALVLTIPTLIWGHMLPSALRYTPPHIPGSHFFPAIFGTSVFFVGGLVFLQGAARELRDRLPGMMRSEEHT